MKLDVDYFLLCENTIFDNKGRVSIINIYNVINVYDLPANHESMVFISRIEAKNLEREVNIKGRISIIAPSGKEKLPKKSNMFELSFSKGQLSQLIEVKIPNVVFDELGEYSTSLIVASKKLKSQYFEIRKVEKDVQSK